MCIASCSPVMEIFNITLFNIFKNNPIWVFPIRPDIWGEESNSLHPNRLLIWWKIWHYFTYLWSLFISLLLIMWPKCILQWNKLKGKSVIMCLSVRSLPLLSLPLLFSWCQQSNTMVASQCEWINDILLSRIIFKVTYIELDNNLLLSKENNVRGTAICE